MTSERMPAASKVLSGSLVLLLSNVTILLLTFIAQRMILSTLTKDANGVLFSERRFVDLVVIMVVDFGINGIIIRRMVQHPETAAVTLSSSIALRMALWLLTSLVCIAVAGFTPYSVLDVGLWCCYLMLSSRVGLLRYSLELPWRHRMRFGLVSIVNIAETMFFTLLIFFWRANLSPTVVIAAFVISAIPGFLFLMTADRGKTISPRYVSMNEIRQLMLEGLPLLATVVLISFHDKFDALLLGWFSPQRESGIFGAVYISLVPLIGTFPVALTMAITPVIAQFAKMNWAECQSFTVTGLRFLMAATILGTTLLSSLIPLFIELVSKGRYSDNVDHFFTYIWVAIPMVFVVYTQEINVVLSQQRKNLPIAGTLAIVTLIVGVILIPSLHAMGAVITKIVSVGIAFVVAVRALYTVLKKSVDMLFLIGLLASTSVGIICAFYFPSILSMWWSALASVTAVIMSLLVTRLLKFSDVRLWMNIIRARNA
ncbi:MAG: oligosaccharide flippase family protein [Ignavibacteria bacterium]|nr:oligosaccharide flippase family protein [Ignavibacteria bacterium]